MRVKKKLTWLLLLLRLPATHKAERVAIWRKLKKSGAIQIQTSTYVLPDEPARYESFQWLSQEIRSVGGDATLVRAREIEGLPNEKLIELFNAARAKEYASLRELLRPSNRGRKNPAKKLRVATLDRVRKQFREIRQTDFFNSPRAQDLEVLLHKMEGTRRVETAYPKIMLRDYRGKTWVTRPRPEIDRVGSAWLIRKFIDPKAKFIFARKVPANGRAISFDMLDAEFSHQGEDCTFETLLKSFRIQDKVVRKIGEMVHDADLDDDKFQRTECIGIDRVLKGWAREGISDQEILRRGFQCFDALHAFLRRV
ncbi:MAG TPA: chromate resistance protein ChrB domain-containing protein [Chthoniobacterales bacterium]|nr:chromate resistance protein ChrB domain-containing protein [Chthoniobacterales bacterium]